MGKSVTFDVLALMKTQGFDEASKKIQKFGDDANKKLSPLVVAAAAIGPAMAPIAAAGVAAAVSLAGLGAVGILAFKGIKAEMKAGTPTGQAYTATIGMLKDNLHTLEQTAAGGVLTGFQKSVADIQPLMPTLNADTAALSAKLGSIASHVMPGLVSLFTTFNPLLLQFAGDLDKGAASFEKWSTSSTGASRFVAYAQAQLPKVEELILSLATTAGHLAQAFAPLGGFVLSDLTAFSKVINAIPIGVLQIAAPAIVGIVVATKALALATAIATPEVLAMSAALLTFSSSEIAVAAAALPMAAKLSVIASAFLVVDTAINTLEKRFGKGSVFDLSFVRGTWFKSGGGGGGNPPAAVAAQKIGEQTGLMMGAQVKAGIVLDGVTTTIDKQTTAAGLLSAALDRLNGASLGVEQTQNQFLDTVDQLTASVRTNGHSIDQASSKGRANREVLVSLITAANNHAQAVANLTTKTQGLAAGVKAGTTDLKTHEDAIRKAATAAGLDRGQVDALIHSIGKIPRTTTAVINVHDRASAQLATIRQNLAALKSKQIDITTYVRNVILPTLGTPSVTHDSRIRDAGGPVNANEPYIIGLNRRPEIFIPGQSGRIAPIGGSSSASGMPLAGGATVNITLNAPNLIGGPNVQREFVGLMERAFAAGFTVAGGQKAMR
jgi:hypothetical protein